jgi:hypothetical protein
MTIPPATLESLAFDWGDAYLISSVRDRWAALRRDAHYFLVADTLPRLETLIIADYRDNPVPREYDPPDAGDYLECPGLLSLPSPEENIPDDDEGLDAETLTVLRELRRAFPLRTIIYSAQLRSWIGMTRRKTISQRSALSLCIALTLIERRERQLAHNPGCAQLPWGYKSPS